MDFKSIDKLSPYDFEIFVMHAFEAAGWTDSVHTQVGKEYRHGDGGVDIFAWKSGRKFAIEVKQRSDDSLVDVKALNQLVTGAQLAKVNNMILVTNSWFTSEVKIRALRLGVELIDRDGLNNLLIKKHSEIGRDIKPRKYQETVIEEALECFYKGNNKILIEMATGLGKTYTVAMLIKHLLSLKQERQRVLFVAHQIEILLQSVTSFKNVMGIGTYTFSACFAGATPSNTDFVFASFDTLYSQIEQLKVDQFDFIIIDEAHHTPAHTYSEVVKLFAPRFLIGLTATPFRTDNKSVDSFFGGEKGHIGKYDLIWALKHGKLAFPKYHVLLDDLKEEEVSQLEKGISINDLDKRLFLHKKDKEVVRLIEQTIEQKKIEQVKGIIFCRSIRHINHLLGFFSLGSATFVHSKMTAEIRRQNIRNFREGGFKYILVCDLFNEGIDIPETNLLVFMRATGSRTVWLQQLGRGLRKTPNKEYVHVLDFVGSLERLRYVEQLKLAVKHKHLDINNSYDETDKNDIIHDDSIEVTYSDSAARVLDLIKSFEYRLNTRENIINEFKNWFKKHEILPHIQDLEGIFTEFSIDQVATHFGSWTTFLKAALDFTTPISEVKYKIYQWVNTYYERYHVVPTNKAIELNFTFESLPEFSAQEINTVMLDYKPPKVYIIDFVNVTKEECQPKTEKISFRDELIAKYYKNVSSRVEFSALPILEKDIILEEFHSVSLFLKAIKDIK